MESSWVGNAHKTFGVVFSFEGFHSFACLEMSQIVTLVAEATNSSCPFWWVMSQGEHMELVGQYEEFSLQNELAIVPKLKNLHSKVRSLTRRVQATDVFVLILRVTQDSDEKK